MKKWHIAADFCLHDKNRPNDVFALTVIPFDDYHHNIKAEIKTALPKDFKKTRDISARSIAFLIDPRRFHFAFILDAPWAMFTDGPASDLRAVARKCLKLTLAAMEKQGRSEEDVAKIKALIQKSLAKKFNVELLADMFLFAYLLCFVTLALARDNDVEVVGWLSDRDKNDNVVRWRDL